jgi:hypothetical protein
VVGGRSGDPRPSSLHPLEPASAYSKTKAAAPERGRGLERHRPVTSRQKVSTTDILVVVSVDSLLSMGRLR